MYFGLVYKGTSQNCTKIKLPEGTKLQKKIARGHKIARRQFFIKGQFCMRVKKNKKHIYIYIYNNNRKKNKR